MSSQLVAYGGDGVGHWAQSHCERCGAWLTEKPQRYETGHYTSDQAQFDCPKCHGEGNIGMQRCECLRPVQGSIYNYKWVCPSCGFERSLGRGSPPEYYRPDSAARLHKVGRFPAVVWWLLDHSVVDHITKIGTEMLG